MRTAAMVRRLLEWCVCGETEWYYFPEPGAYRRPVPICTTIRRDLAFRLWNASIHRGPHANPPAAKLAEYRGNHNLDGSPALLLSSPIRTIVDDFLDQRFCFRGGFADFPVRR